MPDTEETKKKDPMVDLDTSGPEVDVDISKKQATRNKRLRKKKKNQN
jgi:hypothetical protein